MHVKAGGQYYHIQEFAELMAQNAHTYEPAAPMEDMSLFAAKYLDRDLVDDDGKMLPYRMIWTNNAALLDHEHWAAREMPPEKRLAVCFCAEATKDRQVCLIDGHHNLSFKPLTDLDYDGLAISGMKNYEQKQLLHFQKQIMEQDQQKKNCFADKVYSAVARSEANAANHSPSMEKGQHR